jgi:hypothetical protein
MNTGLLPGVHVGFADPFSSQSLSPTENEGHSPSLIPVTLSQRPQSLLPGMQQAHRGGYFQAPAWSCTLRITLHQGDDAMNGTKFIDISQQG